MQSPSQMLTELFDDTAALKAEIRALKEVIREYKKLIEQYQRLLETVYDGQPK